MGSGAAFLASLPFLGPSFAVAGAAAVGAFPSFAPDMLRARRASVDEVLRVTDKNRKKLAVTVVPQFSALRSTPFYAPSTNAKLIFTRLEKARPPVPSSGTP